MTKSNFETAENNLASEKSVFINFVRQHKLEAPALLFLALQRPLGFFSAQLLISTAPFFNILGNNERLQAWAQILEEPIIVDELISQIQAPTEKVIEELT